MGTNGKREAFVRFHDVPLIEGVKELLKMDEAPGGTHANLEFLCSSGAVVWEDELPEDYQLALADAQTAGGLLLSVAQDRVDDLMAALAKAGVSAAAEIGEIIADPDCRVHVEI